MNGLDFLFLFPCCDLILFDTFTKKYGGSEPLKEHSEEEYGKKSHNLFCKFEVDNNKILFGNDGGIFFS